MPWQTPAPSPLQATFYRDRKTPRCDELRLPLILVLILPLIRVLIVVPWRQSASGFTQLFRQWIPYLPTSR
jgi:hypothetical protein